METKKKRVSYVSNHFINMIHLGYNNVWYCDEIANSNNYTM